MKDFVKWGALIVFGWLAWKWISNRFSSSLYPQQESGSFLNAPYVASIPPPYTGVVGWAAPWQYRGAGVVYGSIPPRRRGQRPIPMGAY